MKLSLDALKERAEGVASEELLKSISGGLEEACHDKDCNSTSDKAVGIAELFLWLIGS
jgi:hypothetical protein